MAQKTMTNLNMNRRCEPMGGELDSNSRNATNVASSLTNFTDSYAEDNFIDDLTLKVRSLLKSLEDDYPNDDASTNDKMQDKSYFCSNFNAGSLVKKSIVPSDISFNSSKIAPAHQISGELKYHCNDSNLNPSSSFCRSTASDSKTLDINLVTPQVKSKTQTSLSKWVKREEFKSVLLPAESKSTRSKFEDEKYSNQPRSLINEACNYDVDDSAQFLRKTSTPVPIVADPLSYKCFSSTLQNDINISDSSRKNSNDLYERPFLDPSQKRCVTDRNLTQDIENTKSVSSLDTTDLYCRESSDKETERSWSEITVVAESCRHPVISTENRLDITNTNSSLPVSFGTSTTVMNAGVRIKENVKNLSRSSHIYDTDSKMSVVDWRIEITDHDKTFQESDKEYQFSDFLPNSNSSDLDQIDRDTPPLSASSMASSKRLEWDNGADIGYIVAAMRSKVKYRSIPRSEPEGISFINETNTASSQATLPSFASINIQDESAFMLSSHLDGTDSKASSRHDPSAIEDLFERSSSPGSLSRSDSKKSVIFNSYKDAHTGSKSSSSSDVSIQPQKNFSWPDLTLKSSMPAGDWPAVSPSKMLSKSDEQVGSKWNFALKSKLQKYHFPDFTALDNNASTSVDLSHLPERIMPVGEYFPSDSPSVSKQNPTANIYHACKNCHSPLNGNAGFSAGNLSSKKSDDLSDLQDHDSYERNSESQNVNQINNSSQHGARDDWISETVFDSDLQYITELPELSDYQLQSFNSRPFLLLSHDSSRLKGSNFPNIVQNLLCNNSSEDHSANGNFEVKPHIRWYPFTTNSSLQDIKNVSTQTSVSFVAQQQRDIPQQASGHLVNYKESQDFKSSVGDDSSTLILDKLSVEDLESNSFPSSTLSKPSTAATKETSKSLTTLKQHTKTSSLYDTEITPQIKAVGKNECSGVNLADDELYQPKLSNSFKNLHVAESSQSHKPETEMPTLNLTTNSEAYSNWSALSSKYSAVFTGTGYDSNDFSYLHTGNVISQPSSKYIFSGDIPASFTQGVGVGQCHASPKSVSSRVSSENFRICSDMQSEEKGRSSTENSSANTEKEESSSHSSTVFVDNYSHSILSSLAKSQLNNEAVHYGNEQVTFMQNLDETIPLSPAYDQNRIETTDTCTSTTIPFENIILNPREKVNCTAPDYKSNCSTMPSLITDQFIQTETSSSRPFSENTPFCISQHHLNRVFHKSHSDPLISSQNCETNVTGKEHANPTKLQLPPLNRKLNFELSRNSETDSCEKTNFIEKPPIRYSDIEENHKQSGRSQSNICRKLYKETASNSLFCEKESFSNENQIQKVEDTINDSNLPTDTSECMSHSYKSFLKEKPSLNRKLNFELSRDSETDFCEKTNSTEKPSIRYSNIEDNHKQNSYSYSNTLQSSIHRNLLRGTDSNALFYKEAFFSFENQLQRKEAAVNNSNLPTDTLELSSHSLESFLKEQPYSPLRDKVENTQHVQVSLKHSDVVDEVYEIAAGSVQSKLNYFDDARRNYVSVGVQVSPGVSRSEKCSFCYKTKNSHLNCCLEKEAFKSVLNQTLSKRVSEMKSRSAMSFCVFQSGCCCCCNKTLQEAFNFHRSEIVDRIELRKKEVEEKCKRKLFFRVTQTNPKQPVVKSSIKPVVEMHGKVGKITSSKENKKIKRSELPSWKNTAAQKGRQRNLTKYNRVMSKIYSQRLKNEVLKGKVNHQRHETLMNS